MTFCESAEAESAAKNAERLRLTEQKANELLERSRKSAQGEAEALRREASPKMAEAVRLIIGGIFEACQ